MTRLWAGAGPLFGAPSGDPMRYLDADGTPTVSRRGTSPRLGAVQPSRPLIEDGLQSKGRVNREIRAASSARQRFLHLNVALFDQVISVVAFGGGRRGRKLADRKILLQ